MIQHFFNGVHERGRISYFPEVDIEGMQPKEVFSFVSWIRVRESPVMLWVLGRWTGS